MPRRFIPRTIRFLFSSVILSLLVFLLLRAIFFYFNHDPDDPLSGHDLLRAFRLGGKFDLRLALLIHLPLLVLAALPFTNPYRSRFGRRLWFSWLTLSFAVVLLVYLLDFGYYAYLETRLDASVMRFLGNPATSARMVLESYPVIWGALGITAALLAYRWMIGDLYQRIERSGPDPVRRPMRITVAALAALLFIGGIWGKFSLYPLRWSEAFFSSDNFVSSLALNPVLFFAQTFSHRDTDYDLEKVRAAYPLMADYLGVDQPDAETLDFSRLQTAPQPHRLEGTPNVVLVILESFGFYKTGLSGNPLDPTPGFDQLAAGGLLFDRFYTPHGGTARSVFAAVTGIPDIELVDTSSRNPLIVDQHTIVNEYDGYRKLYFLGGSANWGQIRGLLAHNIEGLEIHEEGSYESPAIDVWGISDLDLFREARKELDGEEQPFFAIIQTSGNHKPYTIPEDSAGFVPRKISDSEAEKYGFRNAAAYNSYRFMDHSIRVFMEQAAKSPWFDNTLFVFIGDHGLVRNAPHMFPGEEKLLLTRYHVPLLFYAPRLIRPGVRSVVASEVDLLPTIAGLTLDSYLNTAFGRDLLDPRFDGRRYAFTIRHQYGPEIGLIGTDYVYRRRVDGSEQTLNAIFAERPEKNLLKFRRGIAAGMEELLSAYYETIKYLRFNNTRNGVRGAAAPATRESGD